MHYNWYTGWLSGWLSCTVYSSAVTWWWCGGFKREIRTLLNAFNSAKAPPAPRYCRLLSTQLAEDQRDVQHIGTLYPVLPCATLCYPPPSEKLISNQWIWWSDLLLCCPASKSHRKTVAKWNWLTSCACTDLSSNHHYATIPPPFLHKSI
jgi:hypothetical protein